MIAYFPDGKPDIHPGENIRIDGQNWTVCRYPRQEGNTYQAEVCLNPDLEEECLNQS